MIANIVVALALAHVGVATAAEPVTVLGLPLGGKVKMPILKCPAPDTDSEVRSLCWVETPQRYKGARSGWARAPGESKMPKWAARGFLEPWVKDDGTLQSLTVKSGSADQFTEILNSISSRFGQSQRESRPGSATKSAEWTRDDVHIQLLCSSSIGCSTTFTSGAAHAAHLQAVAAREQKDSARSVSP